MSNFKGFSHVPNDALTGWSAKESIHIPGIARVRCPFCGDRAVFNLAGVEAQRSSGIASCASNCPGCNNKVRFAFVANNSVNALSTAPKTDVYINPGYAVPVDTQELAGVASSSVTSTYQQAIDAFNASLFPLATAAAGRSLEAMLKEMVPAEQRGLSLFKMIEYAKEHYDFGKPLGDIANLVREGRNRGAHFDMEDEPDEDTARQTIELLGAMYNYVFQLPKEIERLEESLSRSEVEDAG